MQLRDAVSAPGVAFQLAGEDRFAAKAAALMQVFFVAPATRMNPNIQFALAIPGVSPGYGISQPLLWLTRSPGDSNEKQNGRE